MVMLICKTPTCDYVNMFISQIILSGITFEPCVDHLVTTYSRSSRFIYNDASISP